jgi:HlyD family secretion protein
LLILLARSVWLLYGFMPVPSQVEVVRAARGDVQVTVNEDGKTRIREKYIVSAPVFGKLYRIELEEGDSVFAGQTELARIEPSLPTLLDARARAETEARIRAAESSLQQAEA